MVYSNISSAVSVGRDQVHISLLSQCSMGQELDAICRSGVALPISEIALFPRTVISMLDEADLHDGRAAMSVRLDSRIHRESSDRSRWHIARIRRSGSSPKSTSPIYPTFPNPTLTKAAYARFLGQPA